MARVEDSELLSSMKACLQGLESIKLLNPADLELVYFRRTLRHKIAALQKTSSTSEDSEMALEFKGEQMFDVSLT